MKSQTERFIKSELKMEPIRILCMNWIQEVIDTFKEDNTIDVENTADKLLKNGKYKKHKLTFEKLIPGLDERIKNFVQNGNSITVQSDRGKISLVSNINFSIRDTTPQDKIQNLKNFLFLNQHIITHCLTLPEFKKLENFLLNEPEVTVMIRNMLYDLRNGIDTQFGKTMEIFTDFKSMYLLLTEKQKRILKEKMQGKQQIIKLLTELDNSENEKENLRKQRGTINSFFEEWGSSTANTPRNLRRSFYENDFVKLHPELKHHPYKKFSQNYRTYKSTKQKALRNLKAKR